jgi:Cu(I)/Ag(I) efflux system membrane fusion protein
MTGSPQFSDGNTGGAFPARGRLRRLWGAVRLFLLVPLARLRFLALVAAIGLVLIYWDTLVALYEKWTWPAPPAVEAAPDTEFFCPMHPQIVQDQPGTCPICHMPLAARKKQNRLSGEALPAGVVARIQLSPYRLALAGVQTTEVTYRPLARRLRSAGFIEFDERRLTRITNWLKGQSRIDKLYVNVTGQSVRAGEPLLELYSPELVASLHDLLAAQQRGDAALVQVIRQRLQLWGVTEEQLQALQHSAAPIPHLTLRAPASGHILKKYYQEGDYVNEGDRLFDLVDLSTVWVEASLPEEDIGLVRLGQEVEAQVPRVFPDQVFRGRVAFLHPHLDAATRTLRVRFDLENPQHDLRPGMYATVTLLVSPGNDPAVRGYAARQWAESTSLAGLAPALLPGPLLAAGVQQALHAQGWVLAVPEEAVIATGQEYFVYRQAGPGIFDAVAVTLGPWSDGFYAVLDGLAAGERIARSGSFLLDAETRLSGSLVAHHHTSSEAASGSGSGLPASEPAAQPSEHPDHSGEHATPPPLSRRRFPEEQQIETALARLAPADRLLARAQRFCAVQTHNRLGEMGTPVKILLEGQPVFLCCPGCVEEAQAEPARTLATAQRLRRQGTP